MPMPYHGASCKGQDIYMIIAVQIKESGFTSLSTREKSSLIATVDTLAKMLAHMHCTDCPNCESWKVKARALITSIPTVAELPSRRKYRNGSNWRY